MARKKVEKREVHIYKCPHCDGVINPAKMMAEVSVKRQKRTPEQMREMINRRWNRVKLYGR